MSEAVSEFKLRDQGGPMTWRLQGLGNFDDKVDLLLTNDNHKVIQVNKN